MERLWVPFTHLQVARQENFAASGASVSALRASSRACTLTPLSTSFPDAAISSPHSLPHSKREDGAWQMSSVAQGAGASGAAEGCVHHLFGPRRCGVAGETRLVLIGAGEHREQRFEGHEI